MISRNISIHIFLVLFIFLIAYPVLCQETLKVGGLACSAGELKSGFINVPAGSDGPEIRIPITVDNGCKKGPVLALTAGIHGYEYPPILALQRIKGQLDPTKISGAVILVHVVNIPSS
jgi:predicted deacylase